MRTYPQAFGDALDFAEGARPERNGHRRLVGELVLDRTGDVELAVAAVLHDVAEGAVDDQILRAVQAGFGNRVARVVEVCSENGSHPEPPFRDLDEARVAEVFCSTRDVHIVAAADALCAVEAARDAWRARPASARIIESTVWFWRELSAVLDDRLRGWPLARELAGVVSALDRPIDFERTG